MDRLTRIKAIAGLIVKQIPGADRAIYDALDAAYDVGFDECCARNRNAGLDFINNPDYKGV